MGDRREWVPAEAMEALTVRRALQDVEDPLKMSADILKEALPIATMSIAHMAVHSSTEAIRFHAARYVVDRVYGDTKNSPMPDAKHAWEHIYDSVLVEAENIAGASERDFKGE